MFQNKGLKLEFLQGPNVFVTWELHYAACEHGAEEQTVDEYCL